MQRFTWVIVSLIAIMLAGATIAVIVLNSQKRRITPQELEARFNQAALPRTDPRYDGILNRDATLVALDNRNQVLDVVAIEPNSDLERIVFQVPPGIPSINVLILGANIDPSINRAWYYHAESTPGVISRIEVAVEHGHVLSVSCSGPGFPVPLNDEILEFVSRNRSNPDYRHPETTAFLRTR